MADAVDRLHRLRLVAEHLTRAHELAEDYDGSIIDVLDRIDDAIDAVDEVKRNVRIG
jgi:hypothetical protein